LEEYLRRQHRAGDCSLFSGASLKQRQQSRTPRAIEPNVP
jgi:hypothetical protein